jgi:hypothetical protein
MIFIFVHFYNLSKMTIFWVVAPCSLVEVYLMAHWAIRFTANSHTQTSTSPPTLSTILPINNKLSTLVHRARSFCDQDSLHGDLEFLRTTFRQNGYSDRQIRRAVKPPARVASTPEKPASVAFLPYVSTSFNRISRLVSRHNIKSVGLPPKKIPGFLRPVKDDLGLKTPGVNSVPSECGQV